MSRFCLLAWAEPGDSSASRSGDDTEDDDTADLLPPEEDEQISGSYRDALNPNKPLGRAVNDACAELDHLGQLEREQLEQAQALLSKLGYKGSIFTSPSGDQPDGEDGENEDG